VGWLLKNPKTINAKTVNPVGAAICLACAPILSYSPVAA